MCGCKHQFRRYLRCPHDTALHRTCTAPTTSHPLRSIYAETFIPLACRLRSLLMDSLFLGIVTAA